VRIDLHGVSATLLPQRALWLGEHGALLVADAHVGKAAGFRRAGVPVPRGTTGETLARLSEAVAATGARHVIFLGDLLHSKAGRGSASHAAFGAWREAHAKVQMTLVRGNHDRSAGDPPADWRFEVVAEMALGALRLRHEPVPCDGRYVLAGHLHPCALVGAGHDRLRLPCFHFGAEVGVLPAFGAFTGMHAVRREAGDRVFVIAGDEVRALKAAADVPAARA
jgi:DNA ligase-associated metallophosphoesterase